MSKLRRFFYLIVACSLFYVGAYTLAHANFIFLDLIFSYISYPFLSVYNKILTPINSTKLYMQSQKELQDQILRYKQDYETLLAQNIELSSLKDFMEKTKELRDFNNYYKNSKMFLAQIIFKNFDDKRQFFLIDGGMHKGITSDMIAVYKNCIIGKVTQVFPYYSRVTLITDKTCKIAAITTGDVQGIVEGKNTLSGLQLSYVNHLKTIKENELVLTSGEGLVFPRGFGLGKIKKFELEGFIYNIELELLLDFSSLNYCYLLERSAQVELENSSPNMAQHSVEQSDSDIESKVAETSDKVDEKE